MRKVKNMAGKHVDKLMVIGRAGSNKKGIALWLCRCDCGKEIVVRGDVLRSRKIASCGCYRKIRASETKELRIKHGESNSRLYRVWTDMIYRCNNQNAEKYANYGGRGIKVCDEWIHDFTAFRDWALISGYDYEAPLGQCTLDRKDNNGNYEPSNCRWATYKEQNNNTSQNRKIAYQGRTQTMKQWAEELGINYSTIKSRIIRGWNTERALSEPTN